MRKKASILFLLKSLKIPVYIVNLSLTAKYFGVSIERDSWILAFSAMILIDTALWGPINETFRAKFIFIKEKEGEKIALRKTRSLLFFVILFSFLISFVMMKFPELLSVVIAPKYSADELSVLNEIIVYTTSVLLVNQLMQIGISVLNAYDSFYIPEISGFITSLLTLVLIIWLAPIIGIYSLLIAYLIGAIILILFLVLHLRKQGVAIFDDFFNFRFKDFEEFFLFSLPMFAPLFLYQINTFIEKALSSTLGVGLVSVLDYGRKIPELFLTVFVSIITALLLPSLSRHYIRGEMEEFQISFTHIFNIGILFMTLLMGTMFVGGDVIIRFLYDKGQISDQMLGQILNLSQFYVVALLGSFVQIIFGISLIATDQNKLMGIIVAGGQVLMIVVNFVFLNHLEIYVFPASLFVINLIIGIVIYRIIKFEKILIGKSFLKYSLFFLLNVAVAYFIGSKMFLLENKLLNSILLYLIFITVLIGELFIFKIEERKVLVQGISYIKKNQKS